MSLYSDYEYNPNHFNSNFSRTKLDKDNDVCWLSQKGWIKVKDMTDTHLENTYKKCQDRAIYLELKERGLR